MPVMVLDYQYLFQRVAPQQVSPTKMMFFCVFLSLNKLKPDLFSLFFLISKTGILNIQPICVAIIILYCFHTLNES